MIRLKRIPAIFMLLAFCISLTACGNPEAEQRKSFIELLQAQIDRPGADIATLTPDATKALGPYAAQYSVLTDFHADFVEHVARPMQPAVQNVAIASAQDLMSRRADIRSAHEQVEAIRSALEAAVSKASLQRSSLKQPEDVAPVYAKVFDKVVSRPAEAYRGFFPLVDAAGESDHRLGEFLDKNYARVTFNGTEMAVNPTIQPELEPLIKDAQDKGQLMLDAAQKLQQVVPTS
ncbi:Protein of unknown function [Faunimonas pinastri]|uniref:DUF3053 domain-containing protein n=1 Tax=Faunimonas pinastri TaxID=1855383 RepID=A0A1H9ARN5_9HYPH|nr:DUF3053 family protein [Faunimonas pinastri]SEP79309.1 Protein of unknown function [Faunimonas pinastri]